MLTTIEQLEQEVQELANEKIAELMEKLIFRRTCIAKDETCLKHAEYLPAYTRLKIELTRLKRRLRTVVEDPNYIDIGTRVRLTQQSADFYREMYYRTPCKCSDYQKEKDNAQRQQSRDFYRQPDPRYRTGRNWFVNNTFDTGGGP